MNLLQPIGRLTQGIAIGLSEKDHYDGVILLRGSSERDWDSLRLRLRRALDLIAATDERYMQRLREHTPRLMLYEGPSHDCWPLTRTTLLQSDLVENRSELTVAVVLVGLVANAQTLNEDRSAGGSPRPQRARWALVTREQVAFAQCFSPDQYPGIETLWAWLAEALHEYEL